MSGLTFIIYLALKVPEDKINAGIPFPKLATVEKTEPIPDVKSSSAEKPPILGEVPAYALFYTTKSPGEEPPQLGKPRSRQRQKPPKRSPSAKKAKRSL